jgi:hypothetical protein
VSTDATAEDGLDGNLGATPLPVLLSTFAGEGRSGKLEIDGGSGIWLTTGRVYLASTASSPDLAKVLYDSKVGPPEVIDAALGTRSDGTAGLDVLLAQSPEAAPTLQRLLHEYNLNSLFEMLVPSDAAFRFRSGARHPLGDRFAEDTLDLLAKAQHRVEIWRRIATRIPSTAAVFVMAERLPEEIDERVVSTDEWRFLAMLNGRNTVADVINGTGESAFRVCSTLYRFLLEDMIVEATAD